MKIIAIDTQEPDYFRYKLAKKGFRIENRKLEAGDYIIGDIIIERKTLKDLFSSQFRGRLYYQLRSLKESGMKPFLLIEGDSVPFLPQTKALWTRYHSLLLGIGLLGITPIISKDKDESIEIISLLANRVPKGARPRLLGKKKGGRKPLEVKIDILREIPSIGEIRAKQLLGKFGSIYGIIKACLEEGSSIRELVGKSIENKLKEYLTT